MAISKKNKTAYFCTNCGAEHPKWQGQCRECNEWNSLVEEKVITTKSKSPLLRQTQKIKLPDISGESMSGYKCGIDEFDRVMGGHLLPGMTVLLGGEPGIGKSTLLLQA
jgi:DNA repair protein RadA/Sms